MPTSPLKRLSGGGRLGRLLASLLPPAGAGSPLPVQTGFPTSLADIVVKNHGRLRNPRRRHRAAAAAEKLALVSEQRRELSVPQDAAAPAPAPVLPPAAPPAGKGAVGFSIRPGLLAAGGAVALLLLVIWSKQLVAAATLASVALSWIENVGTVRPRRPETEDEADSRRGRGCVSPIREAAASPSPGRGEWQSESDNGGSDDASLCSADADNGDLGCGCDHTSSSVSNPKRKQSRRSLRKLLASKLRTGKTPQGTDSRHGDDADAGEHERPETPRRPTAERLGAAAAPAEETPTPASPLEAITTCRRGRALPLPALVPIILAGLVAGKLPALVLAVLCVAFSSSVERVPAAGQGRSCR